MRPYKDESSAASQSQSSSSSSTPRRPSSAERIQSLLSSGQLEADLEAAGDGLAVGLQDRLTPLVAQLFAPESLAAPEHDTHDQRRKAARNARSVRPGDFVFVRTPGRFYHAMRQIAGSNYDHVAVVVSETQVLHVAPARIRFLPLTRLLTPKRHPRVLRPKLSQQQRKHFLTQLKQLVGHPYHTIRVYSLVVRLFFRNYLNISLPFSQPNLSSPDANNRWICSDAILSNLAAVSPLFHKAIAQQCFDYTGLGSASLRDFERLAGWRPDLLVNIVLPETKSVRPPITPLTDWLSPQSSQCILDCVTHLAKLPDRIGTAAQHLLDAHRKLTPQQQLLCELAMFALVASVYSRRRRNRMSKKARSRL